MSQSLSGRTVVIASVGSLVLLVLYIVTWRKTPSSILNPLDPTKSVPLWNQYPLTRDKANTTTQHATLPTELTLLPTDTYITEMYEKSLQSPSIPEYDTMPFSEYLKKREMLLKAEWISALYTFLQTLDKSVSPHVNLVFGDDNHRHLVMNWITAALKILEPPLHNVMVLSLHHSLCDYLKARTLPLTCITVTPDSLFTFSKSKEVDYGKGVMVRLPVLRLINYWGYDVAAYDCDAVLLRNPQVLYNERQQVDVFSSSGTFPYDVSKVWGFTLCAGTIIFRSSPAAEALWRHISAVNWTKIEQTTVNVALQHMGVRWKKTTKTGEICSLQRGWESEGAIKVFVFPQQQFCRSCCKPNMSYTKLYLVHPNSDKVKLETKERALRKLHAWFLNDTHI